MSPLPATRQLLDVLEAENCVLLRLDLPAAAALLADKQHAIELFDRVWSSQPIPPQPDPELRSLAPLLRAAAAENRRLLERAMTVQRRILSLLAQAARDQAPEGRYGAQGSQRYTRSESPFALNARA